MKSTQSDTVPSGNTRKARDVGRAYCFTYNNYGENDVDTLTQYFVKRNMKYIIGKEVGKEGTPHLQGYFYSENAISFKALKNDFPKIHFEKSKDTPSRIKSNLKYCSKDGNFVTNMDIKLTPKQLVLKNEYKDVVWRIWQESILNLIEQEPEPRVIYWFYDKPGLTGKSFIAKYICCKYNVIMGDGKKADVYNQVAKHIEAHDEGPKVIIIDIPRDNKDYINYGAIEQLKNGLLYSGKYEGAQCIFPIPHVIVFSNNEPDFTAMSKDRWEVYEIDQDLKYKHWSEFVPLEYRDIVDQ